MMNKNVIKEGFPFSIASALGCFVLIKNGLAGMFKIRQEFIAVDTCIDGTAVLCDGADESKFVGIIDLTKVRTGFPSKVISLLPSDFGFETKSELIDAISLAAGREVRLNCCLNTEQLKVEESVFCGKDSDEKKVCSFIPGDEKEGTTRRILKTSIGTIGIPEDVETDEDFVNFINEFLTEHNLEGIAELNPADTSADFIIRDIDFIIYGLEECLFVSFVNGCEEDFPAKK